MTKTEIEPGLLRIFRLFIGLEAVAFFLVILSYSFASSEAEIRFVIDLYGCSLLFGYLSWPALRRKLGRWYLPLALAAATLTPIVASQVYMAVTPQTDLAVLILSAWELIPMLFVPLVLTAWQYGLPAVVAFCILPSVADISLALSIAARLDQEPVHILSIIAIRSASLFVVGYIVAQLMVSQREQRQALENANQQLQRHAHTVEQLAISRERNRLARELHDTLAHTLSGLAVNLEALKTVLDPRLGEAQTMLDQALTVTRNGLTETRRALKDLRASPLDDLGLCLALRNLAQTMAARANLELHLELEDGELPANLEQQIYRIAQEALENVARHANARRLSVCLHQGGGQVTLLVTDDGLGFDAAGSEPPAETFGMRGMHERAAMCGGRLSITSMPGRGTSVQLEVKLPSA